MRTISGAMWILALVLGGLSGAAHGVDLTGRWRFEVFGNSSISTITQTGSTLSMQLAAPLTGTVGVTDANGVTPYSASFSNGVFQVQVSGRIMPSGNMLDGRLGIQVAFPPEIHSVVATRCTCFDGNDTNGDGCDAMCQVEPCWTCSGDPSTCEPTPDGGACDDGNACTTGETCSAGVCGGGTPLAPCVDLGGAWTRHNDIAELGQSTDTYTTIWQRGTDLRIDDYVGYIDPATGAFNVRTATLHLLCSNFDTLSGTAALDGSTYSASGVVWQPQPTIPDVCDTFQQIELGDHCGDGILDGAEDCDDADLDSGDGCTARCAVEPCWACSGTPSDCAPATGTSCDDGDACTTDDTCTDDGTCGGAPLACDPCLACDSTQGCIAAPRATCTVSTAPQKSLLMIKNHADNAKDKFLWRWNKGADLALDALAGVPEGVTLCAYDESAAEPALLFRADVPASPPWKATATGFTYKDPTGGTDGVTNAQIRSGTGGKAKVLVKGKGSTLSGRPFGLPAPALPLPLRVQLQGSDGLCLETRHDTAGVLKNDAARGLFKARAVP